MNVLRCAVISVVAAAAVAAACKSNAIDDSTSSVGADASTPPPPPPDDAGAVDAAVGTLRTDPAKAVVRAGGSVTVALTVDRRGPVADLAIAVSGAPQGVTATAATLVSAASTGTLTITAAADAKRGPATLTLSGAGIEPHTLELLVEGVPGEIDTTFAGGVATDTALGATASYAAIAIQPDGKLVVVGAKSAGWLVRRFNADGSPDAAFDTAASAAIPNAGEARAVAIDPATGGILVGGISASNGTILRLATGGTRDTTYGGGGTGIAVITGNDISGPGNPASVRVQGISLLPDGGILVAGVMWNALRARPFVRKLTSAGAFDSSLSLTLDYANGVPPELHGIVAAGVLPAGPGVPPGSVFAAGPVTAGGFPDGGADNTPSQYVTRLLAFGGGTPDLNFNGGAATFQSGCTVDGVALGTNGDLVLAGSDPDAGSACLTRVLPTASGITLRTAGATSAVAAAGPDDTAYWAGATTGGSEGHAFVERRQSDGGLDPRFAGTGALRLEDPATPTDAFRYTPRAAIASGDVLYVAGARTGTSAGPFVVRVWQ